MDIPFDGILSLLIFLVGIPALIVQLISTAERRVVVKKGRLNTSTFLYQALSILCFGLTAQVIVTLTLQKEMDNLFYNVLQQSIWVIIFVGLFVLVLKVAKKIPEQYGQREKIIDNLVRNIMEEGAIGMRIGGATFSDLASLGKQCDPGLEREMVVNAFKDLVQYILANDQYDGDSFETLIDELVHILVSNPEPKDLCCYDIAIKILAAILSVTKPLFSDSDKRRALYAISKLGRTLLEHFESMEADNIILDHVDSVDFAIVNQSKMLIEVSQVLFEIGVYARNENQDFIAVAALDKMTVFAENNRPLHNEFVADMLGLIAHFWVMEGSRKEFAVKKLEEVKKILPDSIEKSITDARAHCRNTMYFDTADNLEKMKKGVM